MFYFPITDEVDAPTPGLLPRPEMQRRVYKSLDVWPRLRLVSPEVAKWRAETRRLAIRLNPCNRGRNPGNPERTGRATYSSVLQCSSRGFFAGLTSWIMLCFSHDSSQFNRALPHHFTCHHSDAGGIFCQGAFLQWICFHGLKSLRTGGLEKYRRVFEIYDLEWLSRGAATRGEGFA